MNKLLGMALGILTAIGGFVDIGDLVTNAVVGSRFGMSLAWVVVLGVGGICVYASMAGRVAAVSGRATYEIIRERLGAGTALVNLVASTLLTWLTLTAEIGGVALVLQLATRVSPLWWILPVAGVVWLVIWRVRFAAMENVVGLMGLALVAFTVALIALGPSWQELASQVAQLTPAPDETALTYWYFAVAIFGATMTPYEVFFFSSGGIEEGWTAKDLPTERLNVLIGFPLGGILSLSIAGCAAVVLLPRGIEVTSLSQVVLPVAGALGVTGLVVVLAGILAATFGAALETALSCGYTVCQFLGWPWGKRLRPRRAPEFHLVMIIALAAATLLLATGVDPIKVTEYSVVFSAVALPLTYLPILIVANDPAYMGDLVNSRLVDALSLVYLVIIVAAALTAIPLMVLTGAGS